MKNIPVYKPMLTGNEKKYVNECLESSWISGKGEFITKFESEFANYLGINHSTAVCNGTVALHLALITLGIGVGDEVIVPSLTYVASANAVTYVGAKVVFVDSMDSTWQMDPADVEKKITNKTRAILAVHLYGHPCEMNELVSIARKNGLFLIEDCAEAIGSKYKNRYVGTFGDIATFSFYGNKTITTGEGGMVVTNDETLFQRAVHYKGQGLAKYREYWHDVVGYNYRMTNICAAIGLAQLEKIKEIILKKRRIAKIYSKLLRKDKVIFHKEVGDVLHTYWMCSILVENASYRDSLREYLKYNGIETRPLFYPVHTMPMYSKNYEKHKIAEDLGWRGINLPSYPELSSKDVEFIIEKINNYF